MRYLCCCLVCFQIQHFKLLRQPYGKTMCILHQKYFILDIKLFSKISLIHSLNITTLLFQVPFGIAAAVRYNNKKKHLSYQLVHIVYHIEMRFHVSLFAFLELVCSTRVSNELGAQNVRVARNSMKASLCLSLSITTTIAIILFSLRNIVGQFYTNDEDVISYVSKMIPMLSLSICLDATQATLSGLQ